MSEYSEALDRAKARQEAERAARILDGRARRILGVAGWKATRAELRRVVREDDLIPEDQRAAVVARAMEMQSDETFTGRRLRPEEIETMPKETREITPALREEIRAYVRGMRERSPELTLVEVQASAEERFGVTIQRENFRATYWKKAAPNGNGEHAAAAPTYDAPEPEPATEATAAPPTTAPPLPETLTDAAAMAGAVLPTLPPPAAAKEPPLGPGTPPTPILVVQQVGNYMRVQLDVVTDLQTAMLVAHYVGTAFVRMGGAR